MYRWLLCWRYLRTRYIALASVVSVTLGVATLIIVNSVMNGFTTEMQEKMHGILSDIIVESHSATGLTNHEAIEKNIRRIVGDDLEGLTTVVHVPAMVSINHRGETINRQINLIGIDSETYSSVSDFSKFLIHPDNRAKVSFLLRESGYGEDRSNFPEAGWDYRRRRMASQKQYLELQRQLEIETKRSQYLEAQIDNALTIPPSISAPVEAMVDTGTTSTGETTTSTPAPTLATSGAAQDLEFPASPFGITTETTQPTVDPVAEAADQLLPRFDAVAARSNGEAKVFDPETQQHDGIVLGISIGSTRYRNQFDEVTDYYYVQPGDDIQVTFPSAGNTPRAINERFTVVDFYESKMSEYDATFAFIPLERLQQYRGMQDAVSSIQLRLRKGADLDAVRDTLRAEFPLEMMVQVNTWRDLQGALLAAVQMETTILNILLFLIIAVAGFGILATFFMIVVEKTKDIGILKSLGASGTGVAAIFLGYGVLLGLFGAGVGAVAGLLFVANINSIADMLETVTGQEVFDPTVYYFDSIPTIVHPSMVFWVIVGAVLIAVIASVLPSIRAARMHPVEALRYE
jgi:lipoprotein-releasing system permease protein